jgi:hypothetical protein
MNANSARIGLGVYFTLKNINNKKKASKRHQEFVRFQVLTAASMKLRIF